MFAKILGLRVFHFFRITIFEICVYVWEKLSLLVWRQNQRPALIGRAGLSSTRLDQSDVPLLSCTKTNWMWVAWRRENGTFWTKSPSQNMIKNISNVTLSQCINFHGNPDGWACEYFLQNWDWSTYRWDFDCFMVALMVFQNLTECCFPLKTWPGAIKKSSFLVLCSKFIPLWGGSTPVSYKLVIASISAFTYSQVPYFFVISHP